MDIKSRTVILPILYMLERDFAQEPEAIVDFVYSMQARLDDLLNEADDKMKGNPFLNDYDRQRVAVQKLVDIIARSNGLVRRKVDLDEDEAKLARMQAIERDLIQKGRMTA